MLNWLARIVLAVSIPSADASDTDLVVKTKSAQQQELSLRFSADQLQAGAVTAQTEEAIVCTSVSTTLYEAKLFMPDMGHGSSPTFISQIDAKCSRVSKLDFFMHGRWQIIVNMTNGDSGIFEVNVAP